MAKSELDAQRAYIDVVAKKTGWDYSTIARKAGLATTTITRPMGDPEYVGAMRAATIAKVAAISKIPAPPALLRNLAQEAAEALPPGVSRGPSPAHKTTKGRSKAPSPQLALELQFSIPEIDAQIGAGGGSLAEIMTVKDGQASIAEEDDIRIANAEDIRGFWQIPADYLTRELRVNPRRAFVVEVEGDSMSPTLESGDRVVINIAQQQPSPPGIFALWNGISVVIKRVEYIPNTDPPKLKISSDNPRHETYERTIDEVQIVGRARLRVGRL